MNSPGAFIVAALRRLASGARAFCLAFRRMLVDTHGPAVTMLERQRRLGLQHSAQDMAWSRLDHLQQRRLHLRVEREILMIEVAAAKAKRKSASTSEARLREVVKELLAIG